MRWPRCFAPGRTTLAYWRPPATTTPPAPQRAVGPPLAPPPSPAVRTWHHRLALPTTLVPHIAPPRVHLHVLIPQLRRSSVSEGKMLGGRLAADWGKFEAEFGIVARRGAAAGGMRGSPFHSRRAAGGMRGGARAGCEGGAAGGMRPDEACRRRKEHHRRIEDGKERDGRAGCWEPPSIVGVRRAGGVRGAPSKEGLHGRVAAVGRRVGDSWARVGE